jgi:hypothetical protein
VLQASQVEVGISRKETESHAAAMGTSQTVKVKVQVKLELDKGSRESGQMSQTSKETMTEEGTHRLNQINITI